MPTITVHIVESVQPTEGDMLDQSLRLAGVDSTYSFAENRDAFQHVLEHVVIPPRSQPYVGLHISSHGSKNKTGITLQSGESVQWDELRQMLLPLNRASANRLVVSMSTCPGLRGTGMALELSDAPFHAIIGPVGTVGFSDSAVAFIVFYHQLSRGATLSRAVEVMKIASGEDKFGIVDG